MTDSFKSGSFDGVEYIPSLAERARVMARSWLELALLGFAGFAIGLGAWSSLTARAPDDPLFLGAIIFAAALLTFLAVFVRATVSERSILIRNGRVRLPLPARRPDGHRVRSISLFEISGVSPSFGPYGEDGIDVTLVDGTKFFLARRSLGARGIGILERVCAAFQRSYKAEMQKLLREGYLVATMRVRGRRGEMIVLSTPVLTYSGEKRSRLLPTDVSSLRPIRTRLSGNMYEVELKDGTPLLLSEHDAVRIEISESPGWAAKVTRE